MTTPRIRGSFVALITPMNEDASVDHGGARALLEFHRRHGTAAVLFLGSSGEVSMLDAEERARIVFETTTDKAEGMPQWYGCTGPTTAATIEHVTRAADNGADGAIIAAPPYISTDAADIVAFFLDVADAAPIPIGIYNNPPRVRTDLGTDDVLRLATHPNITVHKESTPRVGQVAEILRERPDGLSVMCCCSPDLGLVVPTMSLGGDGTANVTGNIIPREMATISRPWSDPRCSVDFRETYLRMLPVLQFVYAKVNPVPVKSLMRALGMPSGPTRLPLRPLSPALLARGLDLVAELSLAETYGYQIPDTLIA